MKGQIKKAKTPEEYFSFVEPSRIDDIRALDKLIRKAAPKLKPFVHQGMLAYGPFRFRYASGREGDWFQIGIANNAGAISLYCCGANEKGWVAERYKKQLPKAKIGKSCVRFKKLETLDGVVLKKLIVETAKTGFHPELIRSK